MEKEKRDIAMEDQTVSDQLREILELCRKMNAERKLDPLLSLIAQEGARLMAADRATIFLLDPKRSELWSKVSLDGEMIRFDARLGIAGAAAMQGRVINVADAQQDERFYPAIDERTKYRTRTVLAVPLTTPAGAIIGTFQALNKKNGKFTPRDESIAQALAEQAAIAIDNASTAEALRQQQEQLERENTQLWREVEGRLSTRNIIGTSERIQSIVRLIDNIRDSAVDVLITGESGTGKELVAKALHFNSPRARQPFLALNCAALPENLVESELFGIERGIATGVEKRLGKFEEAKGGTLFLDEIGDLSMSIQAKLLRVLQEREITRVGGKGSIPVDVRIIAATNVDLQAAINKGTFRPDLYYRLKVVTIDMPALREVPEDIPAMAEFLLQNLCDELGKEPKKLSASALRALQSYTWPGNVRELEHELKRLVVTSRKNTIGQDDVSASILSAAGAGGAMVAAKNSTLKDAVEDLERRMIADALRRSRGNQLQAAKVLGLSRQGLIKKIKRYKITSPSK